MPRRPRRSAPGLLLACSAASAAATACVLTASAEGRIVLDPGGAETPLVAVLPFTAGGLYAPDGRAAFGWSLADAEAEGERTVEVFVGVQLFEANAAGTYSARPTAPGQPFAMLDLVTGPASLPREDWVAEAGGLTIQSWRCAPQTVVDVSIDAEFVHPSAADARIHFTGRLTQRQVGDLAVPVCNPLE